MARTMPGSGAVVRLHSAAGQQEAGSTLLAAMPPFQHSNAPSFCKPCALHTAMPYLQVAARIEAAQGEGFLRAIKSEWDSHNKSVHVGAGPEGWHGCLIGWPGSWLVPCCAQVSVKCCWN